MKIYPLLSIFILACLFSSCVKDAEVKLPAVESKLVVSCLIYPQNPLTQVSLTKSAPIYNSSQTHTYESIKGATVVISDGINSWTLPFDSVHQTYSIDSVQLKIKANTSYTLSVSTLDGKYAEASTTVPAQNITLSYTTLFDSKSNNYVLHGNWQDPANSSDYYRLEISRKIVSSPSGWYYFDAVNLSDDGNQGGILRSNLEFPYSPLSTDTTYVSLLTTSSEFYNYFTRINKAYNSDGFDSNGPFTEPVPMYTNIKGGLGIFAGFNQYRVKIIL